jgi:GNAT superfamily N-acetyltransferase
MSEILPIGSETVPGAEPKPLATPDAGARATPPAEPLATPDAGPQPLATPDAGPQPLATPDAGPRSPARDGAEPGAACWYVRAAFEEDIPAIASAVSSLLEEIGGKPPATAAMHASAHSLIADGDLGVLLVAEAADALVGLLAASWQTAIHVPGRYALIQDLWVHPSWRSRAIGADLVAALSDLADGRQITRVEVGLPQASFAGLDATEAFYRRNGFTPLGPRMRRLLE